MSEPEAELQATASLSPVSPSPVHSSASQVVPALQDTVDTIDAMVAAAAAAADVIQESSSLNITPAIDPALKVADEAAEDDVVDDDSLNDVYDDEKTEAVSRAVAQDDVPDGNDDYAKTFDSPLGPDEGEDGDFQPHVSSVPAQFNHDSHLDHLNTRPPEALNAAAEQPAAAHPSQLPVPAVINTTSEVHTQDPASDASQSASKSGEQSASAGSPTASVDIQQLVADLTAPADSNSNSNSNSTSDSNALPSGKTGQNNAGSSPALSPSASLPSKPPVSNEPFHSYASQHHPPGVNSSIPASVASPPTPGQPSTYVVAGAPMATSDAFATFTAPSNLNAPVSLTSMHAPPYSSKPGPYAPDQIQQTEYQRQWDQFLADERQYMSEAKWDRFPEGSRIFIGTRSTSGASKNGAHIFSTGNLTSDKVSKRDVFDIFHRFGRLAQISLKSAYGFVQYHTIEEGQRAIDNLQGIELKGRRIHLEVSRLQDKTKKERVKSPDRNRGRDGFKDNGRDVGRRNDRPSQGRDELRSGRGYSPRNEYSNERGHSRDYGHYDGARPRGRSRSPVYDRHDKDAYRRRSPSPYSRSSREAELDLPRRYGADVPDVQIILQPDASRDFVHWVDQALKQKGLRSDVMFLHPKFPKDAVIQRQAVEGVHAVIDLDMRAQGLGKIPVQAFDRSRGSRNVRYDQYVDLDPHTAAEVVLRAKASGAPPSYPRSYGGSGGYGNPLGGQPAQALPTGFPSQPPQYPPQHQQQQGNSVADIAKFMSQVDPNTLQQLLATIQSGAQPGVPIPNANSAAAAPPAVPAAPSQADIQAILGSLGANPAAQQVPSQPGYRQYGAQSAPSGAAAPGGDAAAHVQNIMAQLARYRQ